LGYNGNLRPYRNSSYYTAYAYVPLQTRIDVQAPWNSKTGSDYTGTTFTLAGVPANVKAVSVRIGIQSDRLGSWVSWGPGNVSDGQRHHIAVFDPFGDNVLQNSINAVLPTNGSNTVYRCHDAKGGTLKYFFLVTGYWI
jgi:hypothetical protein